jgi:CubicO group peptidase (beta-lactamase class C family)
MANLSQRFMANHAFGLWRTASKCAALAALLAISASAFCAQDVAQQIAEVETGLRSKVQIKGAPVQKWTIAARLEHFHVPGVTVAVVVDSKLAWVKGFWHGGARSCGHPGHTVSSCLDQ